MEDIATLRSGFAGLHSPPDKGRAIRTRRRPRPVAPRHRESATRPAANPRFYTFPNGAQGAEVEVDPETGEVLVLRYVAVDDYGTLVKPPLPQAQAP